MAKPEVRRAVITSTIRFAPPGEASGYFRVLALEEGSTSFIAPLPESLYRAHDPNPRGGQRGGRGVSVHGGRLVLANAERMFVLDTSWQLVDEISHPLMANVHDLLAEERGIWVTATGCDALLLMGWDGQLEDYWMFRDNRRLVRKLDFPRGSLPRFDPSLDYRDPRLRYERFNTVHVNGVARGSEGLLVMLGRVYSLREQTWRDASSVVVSLSEAGARLTSSKASIVCRRDGIDVPNHNVAEEDGLVIVNDSNRNCLVAYDPRRNEERHVVPVPGRPAFARGLARIGPRLWLVGSQAPAAVYAVDLERGEIVASYALDAAENETIYAISPLANEFADPPRLSPASGARSFWARAAPPPGVTAIPV